MRTGSWGLEVWLLLSCYYFELFSECGWEGYPGWGGRATTTTTYYYYFFF